METLAGTSQSQKTCQCSCPLGNGRKLSVPVPQTRYATAAEEEWLHSQDQLVRDQLEWISQHAEASPSTPSACISELEPTPDIIMEKEAEVFDIHHELYCWQRAQEEARLLEEAEKLFELEEYKDQQILNVIDAENEHWHAMMKTLQQGSWYLVNEDLAYRAGYEDLVSIKQSAQQLVEIVDKAIIVLVERERNTAREQLEASYRIRKETEVAAMAERLQLQSEIAQLKENEQDLLDLIEQEADRVVCRICYHKPRNALVLPCLHFDYCNSCLEKHQQLKSSCPSCRCPISGILKCNGMDY